MISANPGDAPNRQGKNPHSQNRGGQGRPWLRPLLLLTIIVALMLLARALGLGEKFGALRDWIGTLGAWGPLVFMLIYIAATLAAVPGSAMTIAGGVLFGSFWGVIITLHAALIGASLAFLLSRYFARESMVRWLGRNERFQRLDKLTHEHGAIIVALTRLVPIFPFNLLNYVFGLTRVPFWTYVLWSWLCMLPGSVLYVVGSDAVFRAVAEGRVPWALVVVLVVAAAVLTLLVRFARQELRRREAALEAEKGGGKKNPSKQGPGLSAGERHRDVLLANVRPPGWVNPEPAPSYNLVVLGAGTAGLVTAAGAAGLGAKVALVERHLLGGDCLNYGCVPSKAMIRASRAAAAVREAGRFGVQVPKGVKVDFGRVMERLQGLRAEISRHDSVRRFTEIGVDVFLGQARFTGPDTVEVEGQTLNFKKAAICTGARPVHPDLPGLAEAGFLTSETVFSITRCPVRLAILGGGPIGCELAQAFQRLGSQVSLIHKYDRIMNKEDPDAAAVIQKTFLEEGVHLILKAKPLRVEKTRAAKVIHYEADGQAGKLEVDEILVGAGRLPNVEDLDLEAAGVEYDPRRGVVVDDRLRTTNADIFAAGDICLPYKFTHTADAAARIVIQNALFFGRKKLSALTIPWCIYTEPEVAQVGLNEAQAAAQNLAVTVFVKPLAEVDRAVLDGETDGFVKIIVKEGTDKILGATIVAAHAGEMISEVTTAMVGGVGLGSLAAVIHPYPTQAEAIRQTGDLYNRTRLTPRVKSLSTRFLGWRRGG
jgi:pyruvate/2-oxoglutarate dehydrogenase complex dihydrolipoamide dehydrogenase (E3) component/uncharacterized membrane protein YdjX (TVP38/TMEM64 family)